jgi:hypothetical protein
VDPIEPVLAALDPLLKAPIDLKAQEFEHPVAFIRNALLDPGGTAGRDLPPDTEDVAERPRNAELPGLLSAASGR